VCAAAAATAWRGSTHGELVGGYLAQAQGEWRPPSTFSWTALAGPLATLCAPASQRRKSVNVTVLGMMPRTLWRLLLQEAGTACLQEGRVSTITQPLVLGHCATRDGEPCGPLPLGKLSTVLIETKISEVDGCVDGFRPREHRPVEVCRPDMPVLAFLSWHHLSRRRADEMLALVQGKKGGRGQAAASRLSPGRGRAFSPPHHRLPLPRPGYFQGTYPGSPETATLGGSRQVEYPRPWNGRTGSPSGPTYHIIDMPTT
jgi:hypothetical protein